jgi:hypothetical protein
MAAATKERPRAELVDEYVEMDAIATVLGVLVGDSVLSAPDSPFRETVFGPPWERLCPHAHDSATDIDRVHDLQGQLWPGDDDKAEEKELDAVFRRSRLLAAQMLAALAGSPDYLARSAAWLLDGAR